MSTRTRAALLGAAAAAALAVPCAAYGAIASTQKYTFQAIPATPPAGQPSSILGTGTLNIEGLGLEEDLTAQIFNDVPGPYLLVKGASPLLVRTIIFGQITPTFPPDPDHNFDLTFAIPRSLQAPAPGVLAALKNFDIQFGAQVQTIAGVDTPVVSSSGCTTGWASRYTADYTKVLEGYPTLDSSQSVDNVQFCPAQKTGPQQLNLRSYFDTVAPDLGSLTQFASTNIRFQLPKNITLNLATLPVCPEGVAFNDERDCPGYPKPATAQPQPGSAGPAGPAGPAGKDGKDGQLVLVAYKARASQSKVTVSYALTGPAQVDMTVSRPGGKTAKVASARGKAGINTISWNRKISGKAAKMGSYKITLKVAGGRPSSITVKLK